MPSKTYKNPHYIRDGKILLYNRERSSVIQARLSVEGVKGYIVKSTGKRDFTEAARVAEEIYDDYRYRVRHDLDVGSYTFETLFNKWWSVTEQTLSVHRKRFITGTANRYLIPYFGSRPTSAISDEFVAQYWDWRVNYWSSGEGEKAIEAAKKRRTTKKNPRINRLGNVAKVPAKKTLQMEQSVLRQIFYWAKRTGRLKNEPLVKVPNLNRGHKEGVARRPAFDIHEWRILTKFMRSWVREESEGHQPRKNGKFGKMKDEEVTMVHSLHRFQRAMVRDYVLFLGYSGLRPNEARQLRWCDIDFDLLDENGRRQLLIKVSPTTKTGARDVVPIWFAKRPLERLKKLSEHTTPQDLVFCDRGGNAIENFGKTFKSLLIKADLLEDRFGSVRTIYSLRHTYATFRLLYGNIPMEILAQNMGTSPMMIFRHYSHITVQQQAHLLGGTLGRANKSVISK